jgi:hypothetical protein
MVDMISIQQAISSIQTVGKLAKSLVGIHDASLVQAKTIELNEAILGAQSSALSAQSEQFGLLERIGNLEKKIAQMEAWEAEKQRYELTELTAGTFAYSLKSDTAAAEPSHKICANCYSNREKSILQHELRFPGRTEVLLCQKCKSEIFLSGRTTTR